MSDSRLTRKDDDDSTNGDVGPDLTDLLREPDAPVRVMRHELLAALSAADVALDGDSNDDEHDALYELRETVADWLEDPARRSAQ